MILDTEISNKFCGIFPRQAVIIAAKAVERSRASGNSSCFEERTAVRAVLAYMRKNTKLITARQCRAVQLNWSTEIGFNLAKVARWKPVTRIEWSYGSVYGGGGAPLRFVIKGLQSPGGDTIWQE